MGSYSQWYVHGSRGEVKRLTWLCGTERMLVEEVVDTTKTNLQVSSFNYVSVTVGADSERDVWAAVEQYPTDNQARLVVIRDADRLKQWRHLVEWLEHSRKIPSVYLLFVSSADDYPRDEKNPKELASHAALVRDKGQLVRCTTPSPEDSIAWIQRRCPGLREPVADYLLTRVGGNLSAAAGVAAMGALFSGDMSTKTIDALSAEVSGEDFADNLLMLRKPQALAVIDRMSDRDIANTVGLLLSRLELMAQLNEAVRSRLGMRDIVMKMQLPQFLARKYLGCAKHYDPHRVRACRLALAVVDNGYRSGARAGVLELLTALW